MANQKNTGLNSPFDNAFKSIIGKCPRLALALINELFYRTGLSDEEYAGNEKIVHLNRELPELGFGSLEMDQRIKVYGKTERCFHLECQSTTDGTMILRMVQYDMRSALENADYDRAALRMRIDDSGILFLRSTRSTPQVMTVKLTVPQNKTISYKIPVLRMKDYSMESILEKKLYILLPFLFFNYEQQLGKVGQDQAIYQEVESLYENILVRLREHADAGMITAYEGSTLFEALKVVLEGLGEKSRNSEEVREIMGGRILEFSADKIYDSGRRDGEEKGRAEGREEGRAEGREEGLAEGRAEGREEGLVEGRAEGHEEGIAEGVSMGEDKLGNLMDKMKSAGRVDDAFRAATDAVFREKMYIEFNVND